jgi:hypothetical protein
MPAPARQPPGDVGRLLGVAEHQQPSPAFPQFGQRSTCAVIAGLITRANQAGKAGGGE